MCVWCVELWRVACMCVVCRVVVVVVCGVCVNIPDVSQSLPDIRAYQTIFGIFTPPSLSTPSAHDTLTYPKL